MSISNAIWNTINQSKKVLLHCHPYPDPDSVGSVLALRSVISKIGKEVTCIGGDSLIPGYLESLPDRDKIQPISYSEINSQEFDLFIILDSSSPSQISQKEEVVFPEGMKTVVIDHHKTNALFGDINFVDPDCSSTSEVLFKLLREWGMKIDKDTALYLLLGIYSDTGGLKYPNTSPETVSIFAQLATIYPNYHKFVFDLENHRSPIELEMMGLALSNIRKYLSDQVVFSVVSHEEIKKRNISIADAMEGLIGSHLRSVEGWNLVASLVEAEQGIVTVSLRTRDENKYDVSMIAKSAGENGGGHKGAAGTTIHMPLEEAIENLLRVISRLYPELK